MTDPTHDRPGQLRGALPRPELPPALRDRVLTSYESKAPASSRRRAGLWMALAAGLALFAAGFAAGRVGGSPGSDPPSSPSFALLLYDGDSGRASGDVAEHIAWVREQRAAGRVVSGEKLGESSALLATNANPAGLAPLRGFFIVRANDLEAASSLARSLPHFRNGGRVVVRPIDPT